MEKALNSATKGKDWRTQKTWYFHQTLILKIARAILRPLCHGFGHVQTQGYENIPAGPCVLACNHLSNADVIYMATTLPRHPYYMGKIELFKHPLMAWFYRKCGAFPVNRGEGDGWAIEHARKILEQGEMLAMFPEGSRSKRQQLLPAKVGAVRLAMRYNVPVVPMAIHGTEDLFKKGRWRFKQAKIYLVVGKPLDLTEMVPPPPYDYTVYQEMTTVVMKAIATMLPERYRGAYA